MTLAERMTLLQTPGKAKALMEEHGISREAAMLMVDYGYTLEAVRRWEALRWPTRPEEQGEQTAMDIPEAAKPIPWVQRVEGLMWRYGLSKGAAILMADCGYTLEQARRIDAYGSKQKPTQKAKRKGTRLGYENYVRAGGGR